VQHAAPVGTRGVLSRRRADAEGLNHYCCTSGSLGLCCSAAGRASAVPLRL